MRESLPQASIVTLIDPDPSLSKDHHGPPRRSIFGKGNSSDKALPKSFQNPWPSFRSPTIWDAQRAFDLGAAVAHPKPKKLSGMRRSKTKAKHNEGQYEDRLEDGESAPREQAEGPVPHKAYVRPVFAERFEDDEDDFWRDPPIKAVKPRWGNQGGKEAVTWLGHAGVLVQIPWKNRDRDGMCGVIFDPMFSSRASPSQWYGPSRQIESPCTVEELPDIYIYCISHDHYDHLDHQTVYDLWKHHQQTIHFLVPLAMSSWFISLGIPKERITELDWWHEVLMSFPSTRSPPDVREGCSSVSNDFDRYDLTLKFGCTPSQHQSGRAMMDNSTILWSSWIFGVVTEDEWDRREERGMKGWKGFKCFFAGDTGYRYATAARQDRTTICPAFQEIADLYAPVSLSLLPLNAGSTLPFIRKILGLSLDEYTLTSPQHCSPDDSLEIHRVMRSERSVAMHWGTFCPTDESRGTRVEFGRARRDRGVGKHWVGEEEDRSHSQLEGSDTTEDGAASVRTDGSHSTLQTPEGTDGKDKQHKGRFVIPDIGETLVFP